MKISRFFGITTREALRQVRLALGPDALIVSNRRVEGGVEILATDSSEVPEATAPVMRPLERAAPREGAIERAAAPASTTLDHPGAAAGVPLNRAPSRGDENSLAGRGPIVPPIPPSSIASVPAPSMPPAPPPATSTRPSMFTSTSPLGAYAAAFQAVYGEQQGEATSVGSAAPTASSPAAPTVSSPAAPAVDQPSPRLSSTSSAPSTSTASAPLGVVSTSNDYRSTPVPAARSGLDMPAFGSSDTQPPPDVMDAIGAMRGALESRIDELLWGNQLRRAPQAATLFQTLLGFGFSTALLRALLKQLPEQLSSRAALEWVRKELIAHLPVMPAEDDLWKPGLVLALVGPTGVGKTTTIAKLAARCVRRFGPDSLVLITTDTYRIGAHEQLKIYGQMLRTPVHVVRTADELRAVVGGVRPDQTILIDNVGISQRDRYISEQAALLAAAGRDVTRILALNAASHGETLDEVARSYTSDGGTPLKGCIITKVDEATRLGAVLDTVIRYRLPIHYVSIGQKVPEHLVFLQAEELVDQALTHLPSARSLYSPTEADLAALMAMTQPAEPARAQGPDARRVQMEALPRLLSLAGGSAAALTPQDLQDGCQFIDAMTCAGEAYALWRHHSSRQVSAYNSQRGHHHAMRVAQTVWNETGQAHMLAVHDQTSLRNAAAASGNLRATLLLDEHGRSLTSPMQQLTLPSGWLSSNGVSRADAPATGGALTQQLEWLTENAPEVPLIHMFEGGNAALWAELSQRPLKWLAQVPAITRVYMDDGSTTVQAYAKTLDQTLVALPAYVSALGEVAGSPASELALWVASAPVRIARRGGPALELQMISARLVEKSSGKEVRRLTGLHPAIDVPVEQLASWLVIKAESREAMRHAAAAWGLLVGQGGSHADPLHHALVAAQAGMAAWELSRHPAIQSGRRLASVMLGRKTFPTANAAAATFKLFALKEMLDAS